MFAASHIGPQEISLDAAVNTLVAYQQRENNQEIQTEPPWL
jgi:hypothetical protein